MDEEALAITILLVDDHEMVLSTMAAVMRLEPDFEVVGTATTIAAALEQTAVHRPDVVVIDYRLPDGDGVIDAVYGPYWFKGPEFKERFAIYAPKAQPRERYANHFFCWLYDFNGDGRQDVFTVGFPGTPAFVYENPGPGKDGEHWPKHQVIDSVSNESPQLLNFVGDERPELVCTHDGYFGYATIDWSKPFEAWTFHNISEQNAPKPFGHGLGIGDINGDGRQDLLTKDGWFEQPAEIVDGSLWTFHKAKFAPPGGAEMSHPGVPACPATVAHPPRCAQWTCITSGALPLPVTAVTAAGVPALQVPYHWAWDRSRRRLVLLRPLRADGRVPGGGGSRPGRAAAPPCHEFPARPLARLCRRRTGHPVRA